MPIKKKDIAALVAVAAALVFCVCFTKLARAEGSASGETIRVFSAIDEAPVSAGSAEASGEASSIAAMDAFLRALSDASSEPSSEAWANTGDWRLRLVNRWNPIPEGYAPKLTQLINGQAVDERCYPDLQEMMDACRAAGLEPLICSSYRTRQDQEELYENKVRRLMAQGSGEMTAREEASSVVAVPGTSEHQLGLAVDIVDMENQNLDESQENTPVQQWLMTHSWEYGWILRYPTYKSELTGIIYEPWHYRYVGKDAAREIHMLGVCLEEYLDMENGVGSAQRSDPSSEQK